MDASTTSNDRMQKLQAMLRQKPDDLFVLYALGMEHRKTGQFREALDYFAQVVQRDADNCPAYQQAALTHQAMGDLQAARQSMHAGIAAAARKGDAHGREEMEALLLELEG